MGFDRSRAVAQIAAAIALGGRGGQQQLLAGNMPHQPLVPSAAAPVPRDARHLGLMHGEDHRGRGAGAPERVADIDNVADARTLAAELTWNRRAQETLGARGGDRLGRHAGIMIDSGGVLGGDGRDAFHARRQTFFRPEGPPATCRFRAGPRAAEAECLVAGRALIDVLTDTSPKRRMIAKENRFPDHAMVRFSRSHVEAGTAKVAKRQRR
jgi:hypothetical protein